MIRAARLKLLMISASLSSRYPVKTTVAIKVALITEAWAPTAHIWINNIGIARK